MKHMWCHNNFIHLSICWFENHIMILRMRNPNSNLSLWAIFTTYFVYYWARITCRLFSTMYRVQKPIHFLPLSPSNVSQRLVNNKSLSAHQWVVNKLLIETLYMLFNIKVKITNWLHLNDNFFWLNQNLVFKCKYEYYTSRNLTLRRRSQQL